nr:MAG: CHAT domain-containing protein [Leptolyngbya sp. IPPAS B-1204]
MQGYYELYLDVLIWLGEQNFACKKEAFNVSEQSRARTLIELLAESNIDPSQATDDPELKALYERKQELEAQLSARENLIQTAQTDETREQHQQEYTRLDAELKNNVEPQIKQKDPAYAAIRYPEPLTLEQIQRDVLDDETVLLQYAIGEQQSYLWIVPHQGEMTTFTLPGRKVIEPAAKKFLSEVERSGIRPGSEPEEVKFTGDQLYSLIFQDAKTQQSIMTQLQGKKRILIAADGILHTIPFAALPLPTTERYTPLITQYEIVNTPSASTIAILRQQFNDRKPAPKTIALLADPVFRADETRVTQQPATAEDICELTINSASPSDSAYGQANPNLPIELASTLRSFNLANIDRLPCTQLEAESILSLVPDADQKAAVFGFDANYDWMTQASSQLDQYRIVHLATHGFADEKNPELSMLVLSLVDPQGNTQNGMLRLRDIFNLKLNADMVVLSACQTGQGENVRGEGLIGITRGFMYAGAKRVVNSLWYVNDAKTAELMVRFYKGILQENLSPTAALQKAQIQMWETYKKPELWAAFTIQGEWRIQN